MKLKHKSIAVMIREIFLVPECAFTLPGDGARRRYLCRARWELLVYLATYADPDGTSIRPAVETVILDMHISRATFYRRAADLQTLGFLKRVGNRENNISEWNIDLDLCREAGYMRQPLVSLTK